MQVRTDDDIYRARLVYLGPPGYSLPVQLSYAQYGLFTMLAAGFTAAVCLPTGDIRWAGLTIGAAIFLTSYIGGHVNPDVPARAVIYLALTDWRPIKRDPQKLPRLSAGHVRFRNQITEGPR